MKALIKKIVWASGVLSFYHRTRNRRTLSIAQLHRVLPDGSDEHRNSEQEYALTESEFEACLKFFRKHYNVVGLADVMAAVRGEKRLPDRAMLISFDDGWQDNVTFAEPLLKRYGMRATMFVNVEAIEQTGDRWWQDALVETFANKLAAQALPELGEAPKFYDAAIHMLQTPRDERVAKLAAGIRYTPASRQMLTAEALGRIDKSVWDIGSHGHTHSPLIYLDDVSREIGPTAATIAGWIGQPVDSIAFPHGRYTPAIVDRCYADGFAAVMSSDARLNNSDALPRVLGRINIDPTIAAAHSGYSANVNLAYGLWKREFQN